MRTTTNETLGAIEYPNELHFAGDACIVRFTSLPDGVTGVYLTIYTTDGQTYTEQRERFGNEVVFDLSRYVQMFFAGRHLTRYLSNNEDLFQLSPTYEAEVMIAAAPLMGASWNGAYYFGARMDVVWGSLRLGEVAFGSQARRWWKGYPFTLDFSASAGAIINTTVGGTQVASVTAPYDGVMLLDLSMPAYRDIEGVAKVETTTARQVLNDSLRTATTTYDLEVASGCEIDFEGKRYLRWIDGQGRYCYWLFDVLSEVSEVSVSEWADNELRRSNYYDYGVEDGSPVRQALARTTAVQLVSRNLPEKYYPLLLSLCTSPVVEVFDGYNEWHDGEGDTTYPLWHRVNIVAGSYTKLTRKHCEDFGLVIAEPTYNTQMR